MDLAHFYGRQGHLRRRIITASCYDIATYGHVFDRLAYDWGFGPQVVVTGQGVIGRRGVTVTDSSE
jgi:hypothetical protein